MPKKRLTHFKPDSTYTPSTPESRELEEKREFEVVVDGESGKILKIGDPRDVRQWLAAEQQADSSLKVRQEIGGVVLPGMTDTHHHLLYSTLGVIDAGFFSSLPDLENQAKQGDRDKPKMVLGHNTATEPNIYKDELDQASPNRPLCLLDVSFHGARLNSKMLALVKAAEAREKKAGRRFAGELNANNGQATEGYSLLAMEVAEAYYEIEKIVEGMEGQLDGMLGQGITNMHDMLPLSWNNFMAMLMTRQKWQQERGTEFPVRRMFVSEAIAQQLIQRQEELAKAGLFDPNRDWGMMGLKMLADGSFGSHTAMVSEPYATTGGKGTEFHSLDELNKTIRFAQEHGIERLATHAIGDAAIKRVLGIARQWRKLADEAQLDPSRFRIEHFEMSQPHLQEAADLGIWVSSQPNFETDFIYKDRLTGRVMHICPHAETCQHGVPMMFGSDGMPTSALFGIWAATHHPNPKQRISFEQALAAYSLMAADYEYDSGRGRIQEGATADIIVVNRETVAKMIQGEGAAEEFEELGAEEGARQDKLADLETGIAKVYRQGQLVSSKE